MRSNKLLLSLLFSAFFCFAAHAQVAPESTGSEPHLWVGAEGSSFHTDYNPPAGRLTGFGFYGDYFVSRHLGAEAEVRFLTLNSPAGQTQKNFYIGPIVEIYRWRKFSGYGKGLLGLATVNYPYKIGYGSYFGFAIGGGVEYRIRPRWKLRGDYEHQFLPSAPGLAITSPFPSNGLNPAGYSAGVSYRFF